MKRFAGLIAGLSLPFAAALADDHICKGSPGLIGACFQVRNAGIHLWGDQWFVMTLKNRSRLAVREAPGSDKEMPESLLRIWKEDYFADVQGDFEICPIPGAAAPFKTAVCIESASNLAIRYSDGRTMRRP